MAWESVSFFVALSDLGEMEPVNQSADARWKINVPFTADVESFPFATSEGVWTRGKFHIGDVSKGDHPRAKGTVGQSFFVRNGHPVHSALASAE